jgi:hypothetical protein
MLAFLRERNDAWYAMKSDYKFMCVPHTYENKVITIMAPPPAGRRNWPEDLSSDQTEGSEENEGGGFFSSLPPLASVQCKIHARCSLVSLPVFLFSGMLAGTGIFGPLAVPAELGVIGDPEVLGFSSRVRLDLHHDQVAVARG